MDQEKIGKFISTCRKNKGLTQEELAELLGVSKNAVSKWERGICLMDMSLLKPLCNILGVTLNELLSGELLKKEEYFEKSEEIIGNTIEYTNKKINKKNRIIKILTLTFTLLITILIFLFLVDITRMQNNKEVFFSTWGFKYAPPIDLSEEKIDKAITEYLLTIDNNNRHLDKNPKTFISKKTYLINEINYNTIIVYSWVLSETYYQDNNEIINDSGSSIPYKFTIQKEEDEYYVVNHQIPRDGSYYVKDMKTLFPRSVLKEMNKVHIDGTIKKLSFDIETQKELYYGN